MLRKPIDVGYEASSYVSLKITISIFPGMITLIASNLLGYELTY